MGNKFMFAIHSFTIDRYIHTSFLSLVQKMEYGRLGWKYETDTYPHISTLDYDEAMRISIKLCESY